MIGKQVAHYTVLRKIGEGGMGKVYLAEDAKLKRNVALKFLPEHLEEGEVARRRFIREARSAAALDHPFICHIHEVGEVDGIDFIAMEYVEGETLRDRLKKGALSLEETFHVAHELVDALQKAHSQGIVHRDLKPANIMLTPDGHIKVMDFGLAKRVSASGAGDQDITAQASTRALTRAGTVLGTLAYMSPEQACGEPVDTRSDIFSFGVLMYEMLTGSNPFRRRSAVRTLSAILNQPAPLVSHQISGVPSQLDDLVAKMLAKEPDERCQTAAEVRNELEQVESHSPRGVWSRLGKLWGLSVAAVLALLLFGFALQLGLIDYSWVTDKSVVKGDISKLSLAVLPFANRTNHPEGESSATGMTEELIWELGKLGRWERLPSLQTVGSYENSSQSLSEIGRELDVDLIVQGSFLPSDGAHLSVGLWTSDERLLWSSPYPQPKLDIQGIKIQLVRDLANYLEIELTPSQIQRLESGTDRPEAYQAFLKGRALLSRQKPFEAVEAFNKAIELDINFAKAYSGLAASYANIGGWGLKPPSDFWPETIRNAQYAIRLDSSLAEAHRILGEAALFFDYDWSKAATELQAAIDHDPNLPGVYHTLAYLQVSQGRFEEAIKNGQYALKLNPKSSSIQRGAGFRYFLAQRYEEAIDSLKGLLAIKPKYAMANYWLFLCYHKQERYEDAFEAFYRELEVTPIRWDKEWRRKVREEVRREYDRSGYEEVFNHYAGLMAARIEAGNYENATGVLYAYAAAGNREGALKWLVKSYESRDASIAYLKIHPMWDLFRDDPTYQNLLAQLNFPEE